MISRDSKEIWISVLKYINMTFKLIEILIWWCLEVKCYLINKLKYQL
jgi:hypothetical protein